MSTSTGSCLAGKNVLFGVSGSIAAYKAADWVLRLHRAGTEVSVVMTEAATRFVTPMLFSALSGNNVHTSMFEHGAKGSMAHINLARRADLVLVAPATAQTIARMAHGMADTLLAAAILATSAPVIVCPAMNSHMLAHPATRDNLARLRDHGCLVIDAAIGELACGEEGAGRLCPWESAHEAMLGLFAPKDLAGRRVLVTAGPTLEALDPARYLSNRSSGKMGFALARTAARRGAEVCLVSGPVQLDDPPGMEVVRVRSAMEMYAAVMARQETADIIVKAAAVADFRAKAPAAHKVKKGEAALFLELEANPDILMELTRRRRPGQVLVGFAAETRNHLGEAERKLRDKNLDLIAVNDVLSTDSGFATDTNRVTLISREGVTELPLLAKEDVADRIWDEVLRFPTS